ncbi:unnamed protein product [Phaedon cochleariae]|uniref:Microtubule-associated protein Jupiter n=1 Tax=Phaedon cochleariae TaxID=80249 RepID=A0A9N9SE10_PHACE|nr:unnamed protein product [Phaedon cochleariae]
MGDTSNSVTEENEKNSKESITNALRPAKPSENIAISSATPLTSEEEFEKIHETVESEVNVRESKGTLETSEKEKSDEPKKHPTEPTAKDTPSKTTQSSEKLPPTNLDLPTPTSLDKKPRGEPNHNDRLLRNQSDIFSLKEQTSVSSSIFSINGSPSRKVSRKRETVPIGGQLSEPPADKLSTVSRDKLRDRDSYNDMKRPTSSLRNPLTGTGLSSNDEYKFKSSKRKDGNPLLGLGYDPEVVPSGHRIPPGGFSHKLW